MEKKIVDCYCRHSYRWIQVANVKKERERERERERGKVRSKERKMKLKKKGRQNAGVSDVYKDSAPYVARGVKLNEALVKREKRASSSVRAFYFLPFCQAESFHFCTVDRYSFCL